MKSTVSKETYDALIHELNEIASVLEGGNFVEHVSDSLALAARVRNYEERGE